MIAKITIQSEAGVSISKTTKIFLKTAKYIYAVLNE